MTKNEIEQILVKNLDNEDSKSLLQEVTETISSLYILRDELKRNIKEYKNEDISRYFKVLSNLSNGKKAELKRNLGYKTGITLEGLYNIYFKNSSFKIASEEDKELWALCGRIYCFMGGSVQQSFASCLKNVLQSDSSRIRFERFLGSDIDKREYFVRDLLSFVRMIKSKGLKFNCEMLLFDLLNWNNERARIQEHWASDFYN